MNVLTTSNLSVGYASAPNAPLLSGLSLSLPKGSVTALIGANGIGKSTLLRTIAGTQTALAGKVELSGRDISTISIKERAKQLSLVYTDRTGGGGLTVKELVGLGRQPYTGFLGRLSGEDRTAVEAAMDAVGISHKSNSYTGELSDGERQKAMIARALAQQTPIIILDEPTSFLDVASRLEIMQLLSSLSMKENKTILLSTHDISSAMAVANRLWIADACRRTIIEGDRDELVSDGSMERVFPNRGIAYDQASNDFIIKKTH